MKGRTGAPIATPPQDLEAERAVLGAVLLADVTLAALLEEGLQPADFYRDSHGRLFRAMLALHTAGEPVDQLTLTAHLREHGQLDEVGGPAAVDQLAGPVPAVGNVRSYAKIVRDTGLLRRLLAVTYQTQTDVYENAAPARELVQHAHDQLRALDTSRVAMPQPDRWDEFVAWYESDRSGWPLPFDQLTEAIGGGLQPGEVTMLGGWPGMGKTLLAKDILLGLVREGARCHEYANEQFGPRRTARLLSSLTGISAQRIRRRQLTAKDWQKITGHLAAMPYETTATPGWAAGDYARAIRRDRWDVAVIDTVTNLPCGKTDEWDRAAGELADAAAQAGTQLILVCQLNLERAKSAIRPAPVGRDLRSTGAWYQRAKVVMFVHCDEELRDGVPVQLPEGHIRIDKANDGDAESGYVGVYRNTTWSRFEPLMLGDMREAVPA